jgi:hypothetical protein
MDLIDRYLDAAKGHLPAGQQDVVVELAEDLRSRVDERETELGRPLTEAEIAGILKTLGRPMVFASRYLKHRALIGAAMMPYYVQTLKVAAGISLLVHAVVAVVMLAAGREVGESLRGIFTFPFTTLPVIVGWITVVFAVIDRHVSAQALADSWDPTTLPPARRDSARPSRVAIVGDIVGLGITLAWWLAVMRHPFLLMGPVSAFLAPGPGWLAAYVPVAALMVLALGGHGLALAKPEWRRPTRIAGHLLTLAGLAVLWSAGDLLAPTSLTPPPELAHGVEAIDRYAAAGLGLVAAITLVELGRDRWRLRRARRAPAVPAIASTRPGSPR